MKTSLLLLLAFIGGCLQGDVDDTCMCIGQCVCKTSNGTIDLGNYFTYPTNGTPGDGKFTFAFSLCKPMTCYPGMPDTAAVCQYNNLPNEEDQAVSLGMVKGICWMSVTDQQNFKILITGGNTTSGFYHRQRETVMIFKSNSSISTNTIEFMGVNSTGFALTYYFEAMIADPADFAKPFKHLDLN